jgi:hypothetical protein
MTIKPALRNIWKRILYIKKEERQSQTEQLKKD